MLVGGNAAAGGILLFARICLWDWLAELDGLELAPAVPAGCFYMKR